MRLVLLGPPGAGKGTQAVQLTETFRIPHVATGDIFRRNVRGGTPLGVQAKEYMDRGAYVPDDVVIAMVDSRLAESDCAVGFLLDGFPRTVPQAVALEDALIEGDRPLDVALRLYLDEEEAIRRLLARRDLEGRSDDMADVIRTRLVEYHTKTEPVEFFYAERGLLREVDAAGPIEEVTGRAMKALEEFGEGDDR